MVRELDGERRRRVLCRCDCGTERVVFLGLLRQGRSTSCGSCLHLAVRFEQLVTVGAPDACWLWRGSRNRKGYGQFGGGKTTLAHRMAWELFHRRPVPEGHDVHHRCGTRCCVNALHLEAIPSEDHRALHAKAEPPEQMAGA